MYQVPNQYLPPETCVSLKNCSKMAVDGVSFDIWCLGVLALEMFTNRCMQDQAPEEYTNWQDEIYPHLFEELQSNAFKKGLKNAFPSCTIDDESSKIMNNFIITCLRILPEDRPSTTLLSHHKYFESIGFLSKREDVWDDKVKGSTVQMLKYACYENAPQIWPTPLTHPPMDDICQIRKQSLELIGEPLISEEIGQSDSFENNGGCKDNSEEPCESSSEQISLDEMSEFSMREIIRVLNPLLIRIVREGEEDESPDPEKLSKWVSYEKVFIPKSSPKVESQAAVLSEFYLSSLEEDHDSCSLSSDEETQELDLHCQPVEANYYVPATKNETESKNASFETEKLSQGSADENSRDISSVLLQDKEETQQKSDSHDYEQRNTWEVSLHIDDDDEKCTENADVIEEGVSKPKKKAIRRICGWLRKRFIAVGKICRCCAKTSDR